MLGAFLVIGIGGAIVLAIFMGGNFEGDPGPGFGVLLFPFLMAAIPLAFIAAARITARMAPSKPVAHAFVLGGIVSALLAALMVGPAIQDGSWLVPLLVTASSIPLAWVGARLPYLFPGSLAVAAGLFLVILTTFTAGTAWTASGLRGPDGFFADLILTAGYGAILVLGGWVTARLAPRDPVRHAVILGLILTVAGVFAMLKGTSISRDLSGGLWTLVPIPCAVLGARLRKNPVS